MDWHDVETGLRGRVLEVCEKLLPNGKKNLGEWEAGSVAGEAGQVVEAIIVLAGPSVAPPRLEQAHRVGLHVSPEAAYTRVSGDKVVE